MAKQYLGVRVEEEQLADINRLVELGIYNTTTDFVLDAIEEKLNPEKAKNARVNRIVYELKNNPEIREELTRIIKDLGV
jgi:Arc/MetJ-type ribon-helix-helix transcriptional regulator